MHVVVKPWPFRGWAMDIVDKIYPTSSKIHSFILVTTNYFMKWVEVEPLVSVTQEVVIKFIKHNTIYRFGLLESITTDQETMFTRDKMGSFMRQFSIKIIHSTPYYAQANEQVETTNKILIKIVKKNIEENPKRWHKKLWVCQNTPTKVTSCTPFWLTFRHDAVFPLEINVQSLRVAKKNMLSLDEYQQSILDELDESNED